MVNYSIEANSFIKRVNNRFCSDTDNNLQKVDE